jgi:Ca2+-binding RTX toxin-like protein
MNGTLEQALRSATTALSNFAQQPNFWQDFGLAFGQDFDRTQATNIRQRLIDQEFSLPVQVVPDQGMGIATGAFAAATDTVYLRESFVEAGDIAAISGVIVEEFGHAIDSCINKIETPGDEGAIFSLLVNSIKITQNLLAELRAEDDWGTIIVNDQQLVVEMAVINGTNGDDLIIASDGGDVLLGQAGNDTLIGGLGNDTLFDLRGINVLNGGAGDDVISGTFGNRIDGGVGTDILYLAYSFEESSTPAVNLVLNADGSGSGQDGTLIQGIESFVFRGGSGDDLVNAAATTYNNDLVGGDGNDTLISGKGDDYLAGGAGNNTLIGGAGNDKYYLSEQGTSPFGHIGENVIDDTSGSQDSLDIFFGIFDPGTAFKKSGTTLLIDLNNDQQFDTVHDASVLNFYNQTGGAW